MPRYGAMTAMSLNMTFAVGRANRDDATSADRHRSQFGRFKMIAGERAWLFRKHESRTDFRADFEILAVDRMFGRADKFKADDQFSRFSGLLAGVESQRQDRFAARR